MADSYDLIIIGAGSGGLTAASFAARLGLNVALVEKNRVGGDCTWTGCVPSKALLKVAKVAHQARTAARYGIETASPAVDMIRVREYVRGAIAGVYRRETPQMLAEEGIEVVFGPARFLDPHTIQAGQRTLSAKRFLITTGARPMIPPIDGLDDVPYLTYEEIFDNDRLPARLLVVGAGPIGVELAQAYGRLGSQVTLIDVGLLPREDPEVAEALSRVLAGEGLRFVEGLVAEARREGDEIALRMKGSGQEVRGDMLLLAVGRAPNVNGLDLEKAGVAFSAQGIEVNKNLRTGVRHIYAAGDCVAGSQQFTHVAGWQAFLAVRNAFLPGGDNAFGPNVPRVTFTDPEVAHVGLTEAEARQQIGHDVRVTRRAMDRTDRAVAEDDVAGFIKVVHKKDGTILGATIVAGRAGEAITEFVLALEQDLKLADLAQAMHAYPTYSSAVMQLAAEVTVGNLLGGLFGRIIRRLAGGSREAVDDRAIDARGQGLKLRNKEKILHD
ncbi:MAG: dihydrolipoyl dehydrogenase family protein [Anaerolineae bacterium]